MLRLLALAAILTTFTACDIPCQSNGDCGTGNVCATNINKCRKRCEQPADCSGSTLCSPISTVQNVYACLNANEIVGNPDQMSNDKSLGNLCFSPTNNGVSAATGGF